MCFLFAQIACIFVIFRSFGEIRGKMRILYLKYEKHCNNENKNTGYLFLYCSFYSEKNG